MKLSAVFASAALGAVLLTAPAANAAVIVASESFETPVLGPAPAIQYSASEVGHNTNAVGPATVTGVTFQDYSGVMRPESYGVFPVTPYGEQAAFLQSYDDATPLGGEIDWNLNGLTVGQHYAFSFATASGPLVNAEPFTVSVFGATPVSFAATGSWTTHTIDFIAGASSGVISFVGPASSENRATSLDNFVLSAVPEPSSWAMMIVGMFGLGALMRTARRRQAVAA